MGVMGVSGECQGFVIAETVDADRVSLFNYDNRLTFDRRRLDTRNGYYREA